MQARRIAAGRRSVKAALAIGVLLLAFAALAVQPVSEASHQASDTVEFWVLGIEFKGTAGAGEPYIPEGDKVERYVFYPDTIRVQQGQRVILNFFGVNGGSGHPTTIENYVPESFLFLRNQTVTKEFVANQAGVFAITCSAHQPTMTGQLIVEDTSALGINPWNVAILILQAALLVATLVIVQRRIRRT